MSLHIPVCNLHGEGHLATSFNSRDLAALCLGNELGVLNVETSSFTIAPEEFEETVVLDRSEHSNCLLHDTRLNRNVGAAVGLDILITIGVQIGAVNDDLGPAVRVH